MINAQAKKERFLRDPIPVRLGGLAANLARVDSFSQNPANQAAVFDLFEESKYFIEWTAAETFGRQNAKTLETRDEERMNGGFSGDDEGAIGDAGLDQHRRVDDRVKTTGAGGGECCARAVAEMEFAGEGFVDLVQTHRMR